MIEQLKLLFDSINKDAKTAFLVILIVAIYFLYQSVGSSSTELDSIRVGQIKDLSDRLDHCEEHRLDCNNRIDAMYIILKRQDSVIIELNAAVRYSGKTNR